MKSFTKMETEFIGKELPKNSNDYPCSHIEQGYLNTEPVIHIRKQNDKYI